MQRSATSVISLSTETGCATRTSSPRASIAWIRARRLSSAMMDGADPAGEQLVPDVTEAGAAEPPRQGAGIRECEHGLWQVGIGVPMFRHHPADRGEHA